MTLNFLKQAKYFSKACLSALNGPQREEPLNQRDLVYFRWSAFYSCVIYWRKVRDFIVVHLFSGLSSKMFQFCFPLGRENTFHMG